MRGYELPKDRKVRLHIWVVALLLNVIPGILFALAETEVTSILAGIINAVTPLMTIMAWNLDDCVHRDYFFAVVDEVDSILIDEARTPLII